jgi:hypothetical protein
MTWMGDVSLKGDLEDEHPCLGDGLNIILASKGQMNTRNEECPTMEDVQGAILW